MCRTIRFLLPALISLSLVGSPVFAAETITHTLAYEPSQVFLESRGDFDVPYVDGCRFDLVPGKPMVSVQSIHFSIPAGMRVTELDVRILEQTEIGRGLHLYPAQPPTKISDEELPDFIEPDPAVYESADPYPNRAVRLTGTGNMSGYTVVGVQVYPLEYSPSDGILLLNRRIELVLHIEPSLEGAITISGRSETGEGIIADRVRSLVVNPNAVVENIGPRITGSRQETVEYAIVTKPPWVEEFQPLADWKTKKGVRAEVFSTSWIYETYSGDDNAEQIRNFVKDYEANHGLVYLLLGGDPIRLPCRTVWDDLGYDQIQADLYYSDTDGDWNADNDQHYGEHPADNVDMYADIYVGRASIQNPEKATTFVNKILTYEGTMAGSPLPTDFELDMLFQAEILWWNPYSDGGILKDMIDSDHVPGRFDPITKLYEDDGNLDHAAAMAAMNAGQGITNHAGHCNINVISIGPDALYSDDMDALNNGDRQGIFYTGGCYPAAFDFDCIAEHYVNNPNGGGVAFVGNSRYGWGCPGYIGYCASDLYDRQFFRALFDSGLYRLGITHADAKDYYVPDCRHDDYMRYILYELNVIGDPEMPIWTETPSILTATHPATLPTGSSTFTVEVNDARASVVGATVCLMKETEVYEVGLTDGNGEITFEPAPATGGTMTVTVTKHDYLPYEGEGTVDVQDPIDPDLSTVAVNDNLMLSPDGNGDSIMTILLTAKDGNNDPVVGVPAGGVIVTAIGSSSLGQEIRFCESGSGTAHFLSIDPTDGNGRVTIQVSEVGGCGTVTLTAQILGVPLNNDAVTHIYSPDFTGDGKVNFLDTFQYIHFLMAGSGYCGNLNGDPNGDVNFFDTTKYLPFLSGQASCP